MKFIEEEASTARLKVMVRDERTAAGDTPRVPGRAQSMRKGTGIKWMSYINPRRYSLQCSLYSRLEKPRR